MAVTDTMRHTPTTVAHARPNQRRPATGTSRVCAPQPWIAITAVALSALLLASCTTDPPARPSNAGHRGGTSTTTTTAPVPYMPGSEDDAEAYRALRRLDPCALLDPDAGARAVGGTADQL